MKIIFSLLFAFSAPLTALAAVPLYGQCGGLSYTGETECVSGAYCQYMNDWYWQCIAGTATTTVGGTSTTTKSTTTTTAAISTTTTSTSTSTGTTPTSGTVPLDKLYGYATLNGGTTGGAGGSTTTVTTLSALRSAVSGDSAKIVRINGIIQGDGEVVDVGSNTSILGVGSNSGLTGGGFRVKSKKNVIFRNLKLSSSPAPTDLIAIQLATNIWVDHNEFYSDLTSGKDYYDGCLDITHAGDYVTVSWNYFHNHWKTSLIGHSDSNESEDTGKLRVTYHHNWFLNVGSRLPSLRFGTGHVYNQLMDTASESGINSRVGAQMLIEYCQFINVDKPVLTTDEGGYAVLRGNDYGGATPQTNPGTLSTVPYSYVVDTSISSMAAAVKAGAGVGKITV